MLRNVWFLLCTLPFAKRKARQHFENAEQVWRKYRAPSFLAWALCGLAEVALASGRTEAARQHSEEALKIAQSVEASGMVERAQATLRKL
jgi:ATP/maltotriose-dependent transcriptional regulator MalT